MTILILGALFYALVCLVAVAMCKAAARGDRMNAMRGWRDTPDA